MGGGEGTEETCLFGVVLEGFEVRGYDECFVCGGMRNEVGDAETISDACFEGELNDDPLEVISDVHQCRTQNVFIVDFELNLVGLTDETVCDEGLDGVLAVECTEVPCECEEVSPCRVWVYGRIGGGLEGLGEEGEPGCGDGLRVDVGREGGVETVSGWEVVLCGSHR